MNERSFIVNPCSQALSILIYFRGDVTNRSIGPPFILRSTCSHGPVGRPVDLSSDRPQAGGYRSC